LASLPIRTPSHESNDSFAQQRNLVNLTFPDDQNVPSTSSKSRNAAAVTRDRPGELGPPEGLLALGVIGEPASHMPVPETAMYEDRLLAPLHYYVRPARKPPPVKAISDPKASQHASDRPFRPGVPPADRGHVRAAPFLTDPVHRCPVLLLPTSTDRCAPPSSGHSRSKPSKAYLRIKSTKGEISIPVI
jgi:hypothetical protein